jgi:hypothetical protein
VKYFIISFEKGGDSGSQKRKSSVADFKVYCEMHLDYTFDLSMTKFRDNEDLS